MVRWVVLGSLLGCSGQSSEQRACEKYARAFAESAANRCDRGTFEENLAAFKTAAQVGSECDLVRRVRDEQELTEKCLPWFETVECELFDNAVAYGEALPESCRGQLLVGDGL